jgi:hypothetical protein
MTRSDTMRGVFSEKKLGNWMGMIDTVTINLK